MPSNNPTKEGQCPRRSISSGHCRKADRLAGARTRQYPRGTLPRPMRSRVQNSGSCQPRKSGSEKAAEKWCDRNYRIGNKREVEAAFLAGDKSGYRAASRRGCARYARAKKELGRVIDAERAAVDAAVAVGIRFTRFYVSPVAINERADKAEARIKELEKRDKHPKKKVTK